ncbi:hypothetical protein PG990_012331 [Apiospora arundinis]
MAVGPDTTPNDLRSLPAPLQKELKRIESDFTVDTAMLKKITEKFGEELREGLEKPNQNLVRIPIVSGCHKSKDYELTKE